jgi:hypothetical protein
VVVVFPVVGSEGATSPLQYRLDLAALLLTGRFVCNNRMALKGERRKVLILYTGGDILLFPAQSLPTFKLGDPLHDA